MAIRLQEKTRRRDFTTTDLRSILNLDSGNSAEELCVTADSDGNLYVADFYFNTIRKGFPALGIFNHSFNGGQFTFDLTGPTGQTLVVEASTDLVSWLPIWTNTLTGPTNFSDAQSGIYSNRYYRTRLP